MTMRRSYTFLITCATILFLVLIKPLSANSPDRSFVERKLAENRFFLEFINIGISNFAIEQEFKKFRIQIADHYRAYQEFLKGKYPASFQEIADSQVQTRVLYHDFITNHYLPDLEHLLNLNAAKIVQSRDERAIHLLKLGFRDLKKARMKVTKAENFNRYLNSIRIYFYIEAIKYIRQAKRYAFLALMESKTPIEEKEDFQLQTLDEVLNPPEKENISDYTRVGNKLKTMVGRKLIENQYDFFLHHDDNYGFVSVNKKNYFKDAIRTLTPDEWSGKGPKVQLRMAN